MVQENNLKKFHESVPLTVSENICSKSDKEQDEATVIEEKWRDYYRLREKRSPTLKLQLLINKEDKEDKNSLSFKRCFQVPRQSKLIYSCYTCKVGTNFAKILNNQFQSTKSCCIIAVGKGWYCQFLDHYIQDAYNFILHLSGNKVKETFNVPHPKETLTINLR